MPIHSFSRRFSKNIFLLLASALVSLSAYSASEHELDRTKKRLLDEAILTPINKHVTLLDLNNTALYYLFSRNNLNDNLNVIQETLIKDNLLDILRVLTIFSHSNCWQNATVRENELATVIAMEKRINEKLQEIFSNNNEDTLTDAAYPMLSNWIYTQYKLSLVDFKLLNRDKDTTSLLKNLPDTTENLHISELPLTPENNEIFSKLINLKELYISNTQPLSDDIEHHWEFVKFLTPGIRILSLPLKFSMHKLDNKLFSKFKELAKLSLSHVKDNNWDFLNYLPEDLKSLSLWYCNIDDNGIQYLARFNSLQNLNLTGANVSNYAFIISLSNTLKHLCLSSKDIHLHHLQCLQNFIHLKSIDFGGCTFDHLNFIKYLPESIISLKLDGIKPDSTDLEKIISSDIDMSHLSNLKELSLCCTRLSSWKFLETILTENLKTLELAYSNLTQEELDILPRFKQLTRLSIMSIPYENDAFIKNLPHKTSLF